MAAQRGYQLTLVIPDKMSQEKILHLKALGAEVVTTRSDVEKGHPAYYQDLARAIAERTGAYYVNQFENPANAEAHYRTTAPEIIEAVEGREIDALVAGVLGLSLGVLCRPGRGELGLELDKGNATAGLRI